MKFKILLLFFLLTSLCAEDLKRKILVILPKHEASYVSNVHNHLESVLNYYGYFCEYHNDTGDNYPQNLDDFSGLIYWNTGLKSENPLNLVKYLSKFKEKKLLIIGDIPLYDPSGKNYITDINTLLKENLSFNYADYWADEPDNLEYEFDKEYFNYEEKISFLNQKYFVKINVYDKSFDVILKEKYKDKTSNSAFFAPWGFFAPIHKVFLNKDDGQEVIGKNRWIINPFKMVEKVFNTNYPIPDTTTKNGKRIAYIHLDGDGILSKAYNQKYTIEVGYNFIKKEGLKTGVSFIVSELDKNGPILKNEYTKNGTKNHNYNLLNDYAKKIYTLTFVEPATHTYSHPFSWRKGIVAYSTNKSATTAYHDGIKAFQEPDKQVNLDLEIKSSLEYLKKISNKNVNVVYWSGDCFPSIRDLQYIDKNNLLAFNGGNSRFDLEFNSVSYVTPLSLYSPEATQIYSSNSNENTYTNLWTDNFWRFRNIVKTFENTGFPRRIKPANTYYHFYSFEKKASLNSLQKIYDYLKKGNFEFIYPSEFIKIAKNFHDIKIEKVGNSFTISNIRDLREFRFEGQKEIVSNDISNYFYDKKLNVTYVTIQSNLKNATMRLKN